jgi:hypothetical protein
LAKAIRQAKSQHKPKFDQGERPAAVGGGAEASGPSAYMLFYRQVTDPLRIPQALAAAKAGGVASVFGDGGRGGDSKGSGSAGTAHKQAARSCIRVQPKQATTTRSSRTNRTFGAHSMMKT